ncbi:MAG: erythromycin esterase family protein [Bacteroidota bacterium]
MKKLLFTIITGLQLLFAAHNQAQARAADKDSLNNAALNAISTESYASFKKGIKPLIGLMGAQRVVGMGEGTHGTAEFYKVRFWLSRILIEDYGFTHIALENDWSDCWLLNSRLNSDANLDTLMRKRLLSIWQNEETKAMLTWVRAYNKAHKQQVVIDGLDYVFLSADTELIGQLLGARAPAGWRDSLQVIAKAAALQDAVWERMNHPEKPAMDGKAMDKSSAAAYRTADWLSRQVAASALPLNRKADLHMALENVKEGFAPFYDQVTKATEASRDSLMAYNTGLILKGNNDKMIIWAHNAHMAKKGIYNNEVGGTGGYILKMFPGKYMALGTATATGTFAATKESRDSYTNPMAAYPLEAPVKSSWEAYFSGFSKPALYVLPAALNTARVVKPLRFIGYGPQSGPDTNDSTNLSDLFDAFIFIRDTHAATRLR